MARKDIATSGSSKPHLAVDHLKKHYASGAWAVEDVSIDAGSGEFVVLLGPSGCGKTTTLRCIAGLEQADAGTISIGGRVVDSSDRDIRISTQQRNIGMVFQSYAIWPHMTVMENVAFPLKLRGLGRAEVKPRVIKALDMVGLASKIGRSATALSGGEQQRVALARALVYNPTLLLLDEPLSNLDAELRLYLRAELRDIQRRSGVTAVYVTHDQVEAMALGDRIAVMNHGLVEQLGPPQTVYHRPASVFVAKFTGFGNLVAARLIEITKGYVRAITPDGMTFYGVPGEDLTLGSDVVVCFRPENLRVIMRAVLNAPNTWSGTVRSQQFLGAQTQLIVRVGTHELIASASGVIAASMAEGLFVNIDPQSVIILKDQARRTSLHSSDLAQGARSLTNVPVPSSGPASVDAA